MGAGRQGDEYYAAVAALSPLCKTAALGQGGGVARTMQHAHDHQFPFIVKVVYGVVADKARTQTGGKLLPRNTGKRKVT